MAYSSEDALKYGNLSALVGLYYLEQGKAIGDLLSQRVLTHVLDYGEFRRALTTEVAAAVFWDGLLTATLARMRRIRKRAETDTEALIEIVTLHERAQVAVAELEALNGNTK